MNSNYWNKIYIINFKMYLVWFYSKKNLSKLVNFGYYKTAFSDLKESGIKVIYFYKENGEILIADDLIKRLDEIWVFIKPYNDTDEILKYLKSLSWKIFINTFEEQEIPIANKIKRWLWQKISDNPEIFVNKYLQRKLIWEKYPETVVNFEVFPFEKINKFKETEFLHTPLIIKPTWGVQSSWVHKIQNMDEFDYFLGKSTKNYHQRSKSWKRKSCMKGIGKVL